MLGILNPGTEIALAIGVLSGIAMLLVSFAFAGGNSRRFTRRLQEVTTRKGGATAAARTEQRSLTRRESATPGLDRLFLLLPRREALIERLARTGREISVGQYMLTSIGVVNASTVGILNFGKMIILPSLMFACA